MSPVRSSDRLRLLAILGTAWFQAGLGIALIASGPCPTGRYETTPGRLVGGRAASEPNEPWPQLSRMWPVAPGLAGAAALKRAGDRYGRARVLVPVEALVALGWSVRTGTSAPSLVSGPFVASGVMASVWISGAIQIDLHRPPEGRWRLFWAALGSILVSLVGCWCASAVVSSASVGRAWPIGAAISWGAVAIGGWAERGIDWSAWIRHGPLVAHGTSSRNRRAE